MDNSVFLLASVRCGEVGDLNDAAQQVIVIHVPSVPVAQPRVRATVRGKHAAVYSPSGPIDSFKACVRLAASAAYGGAPMSGPLRVDVEFVFPRTKQQIWKRRPMPRLPHSKKPDRDNLDKAVLDALSGLLWVDDAQVFDGRVTKWIASGDEQPGVTITISEEVNC